MSLSTSASVPLSNLPLRPSTLELFQQRGFASTSEVAKSRKDGGLANLAAELGCSLRQATDYVRELQGCLAMTTTTSSHRSASASSIAVDSQLERHDQVSSKCSVLLICGRAMTAMIRDGIGHWSLMMLAAKNMFRLILLLFSGNWTESQNGLPTPS